MDTAPIELHPLVAELQKREQELNVEIRRLLHELFVLEHDTYREITSKYDTYFRELEVELQRTTLKAAEMQRRVELYSLRAQKGKIFDAAECAIIEEMVAREFDLYHRRMKENFDQSSDERNASSATKVETKSGHKQREMLQLYRDLVRRLHPDVCQSQSEFDSFWHLVRAAYEGADVQRLRLLHNLVCNPQSDIQHEDLDRTLDQLQTNVKRLEMRVDYEQRKINRLRSEEPYSLATMLDDEQLRSKHEQGLRASIERQERIVTAATEQLSAILGQAWEDVRLNHKPTKERFDFQDDFIQNTYFSMRA